MPGTFFGWGAGGYANISQICSIFKDLGFSRVAGIFDGDMQEEADKCKKAHPDYFFACIPAKDIRYKKPRKASDEVQGLLDSQYSIKAELIDEMRKLAKEISLHMNSKINQGGI